MPKDFHVMFLGDQGIHEDSKALLHLAKSRGVDMVMHQGDFDYHHSPGLWNKQIDDVFGPDFPYVATVGNHDVMTWKGYETVLMDRYARIPGLVCDPNGRFGVQAWCMYKGLWWVSVGIGTLGSHHEGYLESALAAHRTNTTWRVCSWHKNQRLMQIGGKSDEVGWTAYELCRKEGAIIATGHEHSYARSLSMSNIESQTVVGTASRLQVSRGTTFVFCNGLGGEGYRTAHADLKKKPWWGKTFSAEDGSTASGLFCKFNHNGNDKEAACELITHKGLVVDSFSIELA